MNENLYVLLVHGHCPKTLTMCIWSLLLWTLWEPPSLLYHWKCGSYISLDGKVGVWHVSPCCESSKGGSGLVLPLGGSFLLPGILDPSRALNPELVSVYLPPTEVI